MKAKRLIPVFLSVVILLSMVASVFASPTYLPNGEFESGGSSWLDYADSPGEVGTEQIANWGSNCFSGSCLRLSDIALVVYQEIAPTERYVVVFAYLTTSADATSNDACIRLRIGGTLYDSVCNPSNGASAEWLWACFDSHDYEALGSVNFRLETASLPGGAFVYFDNVGVDYVHDCPGDLELPTELPAFAITATCTISYTSVTISGTEEITQTETITVPANILSNISFEEGGVFPDNWQSTVPLDAAGIYKKAQPSLARSGDDLLVVGRKPELDLYQTFTVPMASDYAFGGYTRYVDSNTNSFVFAMRFELNGDSGFSSAATCENDGSDVNCEYEEITNTTSLLPGSYDFEIYFPSNLANPNYDFKYYVDDVFAIPVTGTNGSLINCPAVESHYNQETPPTPQVPPEAYFPVDTVGGIPIPIGGAGTVCYECRFPPTGVLAEPAWAIAWLGCVIRNMFSCSLRVWLWEIVNAVMGLVSGMVSYAAFWRNYAQGSANYVGSFINQGLLWYVNLNGTYVVEGGGEFNFWEFFYSALALIPQTINSLANLLNALTNFLVGIFGIVTVIFYLILSIIQIAVFALWPLVDLIWSLFAGLIFAVNAPPLTIQEFVALNGVEMIDGDTYTYFWWGVALVDDMFVSIGGVWFVWLLVAGLGISTFFWLKRELEAGLSI